MITSKNQCLLLKWAIDLKPHQEVLRTRLWEGQFLDYDPLKKISKEAQLIKSLLKKEHACAGAAMAKHCMQAMTHTET